MDTLQFFKILVLLLIFYLVSLTLLNWVIVNKGLKKREMDGEEIQSLMPLLISGNLGLIFSVFILLRPIINFVTYQLNEAVGLFTIFSYSSVVLLLNVIVFSVSYALSHLICKTFLKLESLIIRSFFWLTTSAILIILINEFYIQISSTNAYTIF